MYLVVFTSNPTLTSGGSYTTNGAGLRISREFGFGVLDGEAMVTRAQRWINVPPQVEHKRTPSTTSGFVKFYTIEQCACIFGIPRLHLRRVMGVKC